MNGRPSSTATGRAANVRFYRLAAEILAAVDSGVFPRASAGNAGLPGAELRRGGSGRPSVGRILSRRGQIPEKHGGCGHPEPAG
jgi:hypothetical protein